MEEYGPYRKSFQGKLPTFSKPIKGEYLRSLVCVPPQWCRMLARGIPSLKIQQRGVVDACTEGFSMSVKLRMQGFLRRI